VSTDAAARGTFVFEDRHGDLRIVEAQAIGNSGMRGRTRRRVVEERKTMTFSRH
jgi:hypothetical protein